MNEQQHQLINGLFTPEEAKQMLFSLINSKISFNQIEKFTIQEKTSGDVSHSEKRIKELKALYREVENIVSKASDTSKRLKIESTITFELVD
ncbi:MAG: hypothetical protein QE487_12175 [Fluviicola sp.]|nr:hypothetical protein [Fluviicola sp.]